MPHAVFVGRGRLPEVAHPLLERLLERLVVACWVLVRRGLSGAPLAGGAMPCAGCRHVPRRVTRHPMLRASAHASWAVAA